MRRRPPGSNVGTRRAHAERVPHASAPTRNWLLLYGPTWRVPAIAPRCNVRYPARNVGLPRTASRPWRSSAKSGSTSPQAAPAFYAVLRKCDAGNLLLGQAEREVLEQEPELGRMRVALARMPQQRAYRHMMQPTPFGFALLVEVLRAQLSTGKRGARIERMVQEMSRAPARRSAGETLAPTRDPPCRTTARAARPRCRATTAHCEAHYLHNISAIFTGVAQHFVWSITPMPPRARARNALFPLKIDPPQPGTANFPSENACVRGGFA